MIKKFKLFESNSKADIFLNENGVDYIDVYNLLIDEPEFMVELIKTGRLEFHDIKHALRKPIRLNHPMVVKELLNIKEIDPSVNDENTAIELACGRGRTEIVKILLSDPRVDPGACDNYSLTRALNNNHTETIDILLSDPRVDLSKGSEMLLMSAQKSNNIDFIKKMMKDKRIDIAFDDGKLLVNACKNNKKELVKILLDDGRIDPNSHGCLPMFVACTYGNLDIVKLLLNDKRVNPTDYNNLALDQAIKNNNLDIIKLLLDDERIISEELYDNIKQAILRLMAYGNTTSLRYLFNHRKTTKFFYGNMYKKMQEIGTIPSYKGKKINRSIDD